MGAAKLAVFISLHTSVMACTRRSVSDTCRQDKAAEDDHVSRQRVGERVGGHAGESVRRALLSHACLTLWEDASNVSDAEAIGVGNLARVDDKLALVEPERKRWGEQKSRSPQAKRS